MSGDDSRPSLRALAQETVFRSLPLASTSGPLYKERKFLLRLCINQSIRYLRLYRSHYSNISLRISLRTSAHRIPTSSCRYMPIAVPPPTPSRMPPGWPNVSLDNHPGLTVIPHNWVAHGSISQSKPIRDHKVSQWGLLCLSPRNDLLLQKHCHIEAMP